MLNKKIAFISCVNDKKLYDECVEYIKNLKVPFGFEVEIISIEEAESMSFGYNSAMNKTDAKYKVYLHQDTFIVNKSFIQDVVDIFKSDNSIGMIGVIGSKSIPESGVWWESESRCGEVYESHTGKMGLLKFKEVKSLYEEVTAIDGLIMITQYNIPWRYDIFNGWHFYDIAHSVEFALANYKVVVPRQEKTWCLHECGVANIENGYEMFRQIFLQEYLLEKIKNKKV